MRGILNESSRSVGIIIPQRLGMSHVTVSTEQKQLEIQTSRDLMGVKCKGVKVKVL